MQLIGTNKIMQYIAAQPEARVALLTWLHEWPVKQQRYTAGQPTQGVGDMHVAPGLGQYRLSGKINYAAGVCLITWVGSREQQPQDDERRIQQLQQQGHKVHTRTKTVKIEITAPSLNSQTALQERAPNDAAGALTAERLVATDQNSLPYASLPVSRGAYQQALATIAEIFETQTGSPRFNELMALCRQVQHYELQARPQPALTAGEVLGYYLNLFNITPGAITRQAGTEVEAFMRGDAHWPAARVQALFKLLSIATPVAGLVL